MFLDAYHNHYLDKLDLRDCSKMEDKLADQACEITKKCVRILDPLSRWLQYGVFVFPNHPEMEVNICGGMTTEEFNECIEKFVARCDPYAHSVYRSMGVTRDLLCGKEHQNYLANEKCLSKAKTSSQFCPIFECTENLMKGWEEILGEVDPSRID